MPNKPVNQKEDYTEAADVLIKLLSEDKRYIEYKRAKSAVESDERTMGLLSEFKRMNKSYQYKKQDGEDIPFDEEKRISYIYWLLNLDPAAREFMLAEQELAELLHGVFNQTITAFDMNVDFFL